MAAIPASAGAGGVLQVPAVCGTAQASGAAGGMAGVSRRFAEHVSYAAA